MITDTTFFIVGWCESMLQLMASVKGGKKKGEKHFLKNGPIIGLTRFTSKSGCRILKSGLTSSCFYASKLILFIVISN